MNNAELYNYERKLCMKGKGQQSEGERKEYNQEHLGMKIQKHGARTIAK